MAQGVTRLPQRVTKRSDEKGFSRHHSFGSRHFLRQPRHSFGSHHSFKRVIHRSKINPGIAITAQNTKKPAHPSHAASQPVGAAAITRGTPIRLESSAYWVAVKRRSVSAAMKPTNAAVPRPAVKFSIATTVASAPAVGGTIVSTAKPNVEIICPKPKI